MNFVQTSNESGIPRRKYASPSWCRLDASPPRYKTDAMPPRQRKGKPAWRGSAICMNFISFARQVRKAGRCKYIYRYIGISTHGSKDQRAFTTVVWRSRLMIAPCAFGKSKFKSRNVGKELGNLAKYVRRVIEIETRCGKMEWN